MVQKPTSEVILRIFQSGYCVADGHVVNPKAPRKKVRFYATWLLIQHPTQGNILFDTGYTPRFYEATARFPYRLYAWVTPVFIKPQETAIAQLQALGITPKDIGRIIVSHFHADHVGGLKDFPFSRFICSRASRDEVISKKGWAAVAKGLLPDLLPDDLLNRTDLLEDLTDAETDVRSGLIMYDLFGDGLLKLIELPGHARGMLGIRIQHATGITLFASDAFWSTYTFEQKILPRKRVKLFFDSWTDYVSSFEKLHRYHLQHPEEKILFTHSPQTLELVSGVPMASL